MADGRSENLRGPALDRRRVLTGSSAGAAGLVVGFYLPACGRGEAGAHEPESFAPNAWIRISPDDQVTILAETPELGQGSRTYNAMLVAEELEVPWEAIRVEQAPTLPSVYKQLRTGGSGGLKSVFAPMRRAGAQAREMLISAAMQEWRAARTDCQAANGAVIHTPTGRRLRYGDLAQAAARLPRPDPAGLRLKTPAQFRIIGRRLPRTDLPGKVDGSAVFGLDVRPPGLLFAVIARCPYFGGRLKAWDAGAARAMPGVRAIFPVAPLPRRFNTAGGVAVVADNTWAAIQARRALRLEWERPEGAPESTEALRRHALERASGPPSYVAVARGDPDSGLARAATVLEADYESPFQAHATMEPMNTTVQVRGGEIEVWSPTQFAAEVRKEIAELSGLSPEKVIVHMTLSGGSFGRRYQWDVPAEAWQVARAMPAPVQLVWTREDDFGHDFYRPHNLQRLRAGLAGDGRILGWTTRIVSTPIAATNAYTDAADTPAALKDPAVVASLEWFGADVTPYAIRDARIDYAPADSVVPRSWWRGVASSYTPFAKECFIDELAHAAGKDPLEFRLALLEGGGAEADRLVRVLKLAADRAGWGRPSPEGAGRGIACRAGESCVAEAAEVAVDSDGRVKVRRVVAAIDCGIAVNPDGVSAMMEGGINFALTAALMAQITVKDGAVEQANFDSYRVLRLADAPEIETIIVPSTAPPGGAGELGAMVLAPAVANAVFAATGVRVRRLPIDSEVLKVGLAQRRRAQGRPG
jgi:isoquinoline 1-oxidoreductase beta subunit